MFITFFIAALFANFASATELKTLSWNVYMLPKPIKFSQQELRAKKIPVALQNSDYDFMFFQEAFHPLFRKDMWKALKNKYPHNMYLNRRKTVWPPMGSGLFVMSKHPFKVLEHIFYKKCAVADCYASKGSMLIESQVDGRTVQFAMTHLQAELGFGEIRLSQIQQIKEMLARHAKDGVPQILIGDLNIDHKEPEFPEGQDLLGMEASTLSGPLDYTAEFPNKCFHVGINNLTWLDHLWFDGKGTSVSTKFQTTNFEFNYKGMTCELSDHMPMESQISLN
ncbi:MAG: hypothetical protein ACJ76H_07960 [Bacteriovoracaceae bacterium]